MRRAVDEYNLNALPNTSSQLLNTHWRDLEINFIDCETTGFDPYNDEIIQFVSVVTRLTNKGMEVLDTTDLYFKPRTAVISEKITQITGISNEDVADKEHFNCKEVMVALSKGDIIAGYNVLDFDLDFLNVALNKKEYHFPRKPVLDLLFWCRYHYKKYNKVKQSDMAKAFGVQRMSQVEHGREQLHNALTDCIIGSELMWAMSKEAIPVWSLSELLNHQFNIYEEQNKYLMKKYGEG